MKRKSILVLSGLALSAGSALADVPTAAELTTDLTGKVTTYGAVMIAVVVALVGFKIIKRMINKA